MITNSSPWRIRAGSQELPSRITVLVFTTLSRIFIFTPLLLCSVRKASRECTVPCSGGPGACLMVRESQCTASILYSDCTVQWLQLHRQEEPPESVCHELHLVGSDADTCWVISTHLVISTCHSDRCWHYINTVTVIVLQVTRGPFTLKSLYVMKYIVWPMLMIDDEVVSQATRKMFEFQWGVSEESIK